MVVNTSDGTATVADNDYLPVVDQLVVFPSGTFIQQVPVTVVGDLRAEPDETFFVHLHDAVNGIISVSPGVGTIQNSGKIPGLEGDVVPRPTGDFMIGATDVTQLRRFVAALDVPGPSEAMRADCAPRASFGDGVLNAADVIQTRRYSVGLDPATPTGGPSFFGLSERVSVFLSDTNTYFWSRTLQVGDAKAEGDRVSVPIEIDALGDEAAVGFTLEYDREKLADPVVKLGQAVAADTVLTINDDGQGRIAILIDSSRAALSSGGAGPVITVSFRVVPRASGESVLAITDSLAEKSIADVNGNLVSTRWINGRVSINAF